MGSPNRRATNEAGFTIIESTIALAVVFVVLVGLLGALTTGVRGLVTGRQRSASLALANEVMENARGRAYGDVGHDFDSDPSLATDPLITGTAPNLKYKGEFLATSSVDAGALGGTVTNPLFPFSPHKFTTKREATTYTTSVYVTTVTPTTGGPYKRITTIVSWSPAQYVTAAKSVTISSFLYNAAAPPDPKLVGTGEADSGTFKVTGTLVGAPLTDFSLTLPYVSGRIDSQFVRSAKGLARSGASELNLGGLGLWSYGPVLADADADNDFGTAPPETDQEHPGDVNGGSIGVPLVLAATFGSGSAEAQATARSCWACYPSDPPVGDNDGLPHFHGRATGPGLVSVDFVASTVLGKLLTFGATPVATVDVDRFDSTPNQLVGSDAQVSFPAIDLLPLTVKPVGYSGVVKVDAVTARAQAYAGPGASDPSVTAALVNVRYWNGVGYTTVGITPGTEFTTTIPSVSLPGGVTVSGSITSTPKVTDRTASGGAINSASAGLTNWLFIDLNVKIKPLLVELANLNLHLDYGRLAATAEYDPAA